MSPDSAHLTVVHSGTPFEILRGRYIRQRFAPHLHDTYAIGVIESGAAKCDFRGKEVVHAAGDLITIEPGEVHTGEPASAEGWSYRMLYVPRELMARAWEGDALPRFPRTGTADWKLAREMAVVHALLEQRGDALHQESALIAVLRALCEHHALGAGPPECRASPAALARVKEYLDVHFAQAVTLAELGAVAGVSLFHLIRQFRRHYGLPPYMYLEMLRVEQAKEMLQQGARVSDAAFATGFSDQSHLARHFKRVFGVPPGRYARSYRLGVAYGRSAAS